MSTSKSELIDKYGEDRLISLENEFSKLQIKCPVVDSLCYVNGHASDKFIHFIDKYENNTQYCNERW